MGIQYGEICKGLGIVLGTWKVLNKGFYGNVCPMAQAGALAVSFFAPRWQHSLQSVGGLRGPMAPCAQLCCSISHERFGAPIFQNMAMERVYTHF